jgi:hypothetical protein
MSCTATLRRRSAMALVMPTARLDRSASAGWVVANLTPEGGTREDEYGDPAIGSHVWDHLLAVSERMGDKAQLLVVDNRPRQQADLAVVVR